MSAKVRLLVRSAGQSDCWASTPNHGGEALDEGPHSHGGLSEFQRQRLGWWQLLGTTTSLQDPYGSGHGTIQYHFLAFTSEFSHMPLPVSKMMISFFFYVSSHISSFSAEASGAWGVEIGMFLMSISGYQINKNKQQQQNPPPLCWHRHTLLDPWSYSEDSPKTSRSSGMYSIKSEASMSLDGLKGYLIW